MKRLFDIFAVAAIMLAISCKPVTPETPGDDEDDNKQNTPTEKLANITYQINVYSFADSDGDGWGDLQGIINHLDYLDELGVTGLWLSPIHPAMSYHGYDITDYSAVNPKFGGANATAAQAEAKLQELITAAKAKDISIYLDYVLNHCGKDHPYFREACKDQSSQWREAFIFSSNPAADIKAGKFAMIPSTDSYDAGQWYPTPENTGSLGYNGLLHFKLDVSSASAPKLTITKGSNSPQSSNSDTSVKWFIYENNPIRMYKSSDTIYEITLNINNSWGVLVKDDESLWGDHKWGARAGDQTVTFGTAKTLVKGDAANDITFGEVEYYHSHMWTDWFADWNYGAASTSEQSVAFKHLAETADKWINMGVDGLRLDAVKHIYHNESNSDNPTFLAKWYDHCNATYKARGGEGDIYMVGEVFSDANAAAPYYKGLPSLFNFSFWWTLQDRIKNAKGNDFAKTVIYFRDQFKSRRSGFIDAIKLSNHDENRAASDLGKSVDKEKLAGCVLLTSPGKPFIYQGEELGYWGVKDGGDEYVRTPIKWTKSGSVPTKGLNGKVDNTMLTADISVEAQSASNSSILSVYRKFAAARNSYKALASGEIAEVSSSNKAIAMWTMTYDGQTVLVVHNFGSNLVTMPVSGYKLSEEIVSNGVVTTNGTNLAMAGYSSAVYLQ